MTALKQVYLFFFQMACTQKRIHTRHRPKSVTLLVLLDLRCACSFILENFIYLIIGRGEGKEKERTGNTNQLPLGHNPD